MNKLKITEKGINFLLIFILGFLVGVAIKSEAQKRLTIGYNDYLVPKYKQDVNLMAPTAPAPQPQGQDQNPGPSAGSEQGAGQQNAPSAPEGSQPQQ